MSHNEFEAIMRKMMRAITLVNQAEVETYYNVSDVSAMELKRALSALEHAAENMDGE